MSYKRNCLKLRGAAVLAALATMIFAAAANAQAPNCNPDPLGAPPRFVSPTAVTVSKNPEHNAMFCDIQSAVNAVRANGVIEILDAADGSSCGVLGPCGVYTEMVIIDGRDNSPWTTVPKPAGGGVALNMANRGKNGITIRYRPPAVNANTPGTWGPAGPLAHHPRPIIRFNDTFNRNPTSNTAGSGHPDNRPILDGGTDGELSGSNNWWTGGALRILNARGVTIDGVEIDGVIPAFHHSSGFWNSGLVMGNNGISIYNSGEVTIRNSVIRNASKGINIKDRNPQGAFAVRNPHDPSEPTPLGRFGRMGDHVIEYNRFINNHQAIYMESMWDLSNTFRHNLFLNAAAGGGSGGPGDMRTTGAMAWRDSYNTPFIINNNTFHGTTNALIGMWQSGVQHLLFNNIFGFQSANENNLTGRFPRRSYHNTFSARGNPSGQLQDIQTQWPGHWVENNHNRPAQWPAELRLADPNAGPSATEVSRDELIAARTACLNQISGLPGVSQGGFNFRPAGNSQLQMEWAGMSNPAAGTGGAIVIPQESNNYTFMVTANDGTEHGPYACRAFIEGREATWSPTATEPTRTVTGAILPGAIIPPANVAGAATRNMWFEIDNRGSGNGYYVMAGTVNQTAVGFLQPNWSDPVVAATVRNGGWPAIWPAGTQQNQLPDIGAVQQSAPSRYVAHIRATNAVGLSNTLRATGQYRFSVFDRETGERVDNVTGASVTLLRFIYPVPNTRNVQGGNDAQMVAESSIRNVSPSSITNIAGTGAHTININANSSFATQFASNAFNIIEDSWATESGTTIRIPTIGFFEIAISASVGGELVTAIGILPYRRITHTIDVSFHPPTGTPSPQYQPEYPTYRSCPSGALPANHLGCGYDTVLAGREYRMMLNFYDEGNVYVGTITGADFELTSDALAFLYCATGNVAGTSLACQPTNNQKINIPGMEPPSNSDFPLGTMATVLSTHTGAITGGQGHGAFFTRAGSEMVLVTAWGRPQNATSDVAFIGTREIVVMPGPPAKLAFENPAPRRTLEITPGGCEKSLYPTPNVGNIASCAPAGIITRGAEPNVDVIVQDRFSNAVNQAVTVSISSDAPNIGNVRARTAPSGTFTNQTATTSPHPDPTQRGRAQFTAEVTNGAQGQWFDMTAVSDGLTPDIARFRLGRPSSNLRAFYSDVDWERTQVPGQALPGRQPAQSRLEWPNYYDESHTINGQANGERHMITIMATDPTTVLTNWTGWIDIQSADPENHRFLFWESETATQPTTTLQVVAGSGGEVRFWISVTSESDIVNGCIGFRPFANAALTIPDGNIDAGSRCGLYFTAPASGIQHATIFGNGDGAPASVRVFFLGDAGMTIGGPNSGAEFPLHSISVKWPPVNIGGGVWEGQYEYTVPYSTTAFTVDPNNPLVLNVSLATATSTDVGAPPLRSIMGRTSIPGTGVGFVAVHLGDGTDVRASFPVHDGIGPMIASNDFNDSARLGPQIVENTQPGVRPDTIIFQFTEPYRMLPPPFADGNQTIQMTRVGVNQDPNDMVAGVTWETLSLIGNTPTTALQGVKVTLAMPTPYAPRPEDFAAGSQYSYWIRFVPNTEHIADLGSPEGGTVGNNPHSSNRWAMLELKPSPPGVLAAWYTADPRTGLLDTATIVFDKQISDEWLDSARFRFGTAGIDLDDSLVTTALLDSGKIRITNFDGGSDSVMKVCLKTFWPKRNYITTFGTHNFEIVYPSGNYPSGRPRPTSDWGSTPITLADSAAPVIANDMTISRTSPPMSARARYKSGEAGVAFDTIIVRMSETPPFTETETPLTLVQENGSREELLQLTRVEAFRPLGGYFEVKYLADTSLFSNLRIRPERDSLRITAPGPQGSGVGGVTDVLGNVQDHPENRAVPFYIEYTYNWEHTVINNPGRPGKPGEEINIIVYPGPGVRGELHMRADVTIYDNIGNVVYKGRVPRNANDCGGTQYYSSADGGSCKTTTGLKLLGNNGWDARNRRGRMVGTGTYLLRANIYGKVLDEEDCVPSRENNYCVAPGSDENTSISVPFGVVR